MDCSGSSHFNGTTFMALRHLSWALCMLGVWAATLQAAAGTPDRAPFTIDANYPGGNIVVERIEGDTVHVRPDLRDTEGWWFYWNFRVRRAQGRTLTFQFGNPGPVGVRGPAVSLDGGKGWAWHPMETSNPSSFTYTFGDVARDVRFCMAMPYLDRNLQAFLSGHQDDRHLQVNELCRTAKGRSVTQLNVGRLDGDAAFCVLLTARHHACEMMASYVLEGALAAMLAPTDDGRWFQQNVEVLAIPFMDTDGVAEGDQGKNRKPRDHNRDYAGRSIYPSVAHLRKFVPTWSQGKPVVTLDLHCPHIRGAYNEVIYMVGSADESIWQEQCRFGRILENVQQGPLVYRASDNLPFGTAWNTASNYSQGKSCRAWASELEGVRLATTFEVPYANAGGRAVTADSARQFGRNLAVALRQYLQQLDTETSQ